MAIEPCLEQRPARSAFVDVRGLRTHVLVWGDAADVAPERPPLVMLHGWMDVGASFQFVVDALRDARCVVAPNWRGFGETEWPRTDSYWFPDYLGDLDALLDALPETRGQAVDLLGHSMGANVAMLYAGVRAERVRRLAALEGFGRPATRPEDAPGLLRRWLDELRTPAELRTYPGIEAVAERLRRTNPLLRADRAAWLAQRWSRPCASGNGTLPSAFEILADPAHKRTYPVLYRVEEVLATWRAIRAPLLWIEGDRTDIAYWWGDSYSKEEFHRRLDVVPRVERHVIGPAGHMLHHDQPEQLARLLEAFLDRTDAAGA